MSTWYRCTSCGDVSQTTFARCRKCAGDLEAFDPDQHTRDTHLVVILDRSGSMLDQTEPTIKAFNKFVEEHQTLPGQAWLTLVLFNDEVQTPYRRIPIREVEPLTQLTYRAEGSTKLYDAIGETLTSLHEEITPTITCILTDGLENDSQVYTTPESIKALIEAARERGWEFVFLGANQDAILAGSSLGISQSATMSTMNLTSEGFEVSYACSSSYRMGGATGTATSWVFVPETISTPEDPI